MALTPDAMKVHRGCIGVSIKKLTLACAKFMPIILELTSKNNVCESNYQCWTLHTKRRMKIAIIANLEMNSATTLI